MSIGRLVGKVRLTAVFVVGLPR